MEMGQGTKTALAQIVAERMKMDIRQIHVSLEVDSQLNPEHWKTVASMSVFMNGNAIGGQIMGHGNYIMKRLSSLDPNTGKEKPSPGWTVGAQAVEVEFDSKDYTYKVLKAASVFDVGRVINPRNARGVVTGAMCMGLGIGSKEAFVFSQQGMVENFQLRTYKLMRFGEQPEYLVEFMESPQLDAPYGARGIGEHGIVGIPAALANALSSAAQVDLHQLPLTPELIWKTKTGGQG